MKNRKRYLTQSEQADTFWPSFTDLISTFVLILFILVLLSFIQNIITNNNLKFAKQELEQTNTQLEESKIALSDAEDALMFLNDKLEETKAEIERGQVALKLSEEQIENQQKIIAESNKELGELRSRLQGVSLLRVNVVENVKDNIEDALGKTNHDGKPIVTIGNTGNIIINENLVFDYNSASIKAEGEVLLQKLADAFYTALSDFEVRDNIESIMIQGHTDKRGDSDYNRELSAKRAAAVVNYFFSSNKQLESRYGEYFASTAFSEYRPLALGNSEEAHAKNRRIEIAIVLKDSEVQNVIDEYLDETKDFLKDLDE